VDIIEELVDPIVILLELVSSVLEMLVDGTK